MCTKVLLGLSLSGAGCRGQHELTAAAPAGRAGGLLFFHLPPEHFFTGSAAGARLQAARLAARGWVHPVLSPLAPELFESDFRAAPWDVLLRLVCPVLFGSPRKVPWEACQMVW